MLLAGQSSKMAVQNRKNRYATMVAEPPWLTLVVQQCHVGDDVPQTDDGGVGFGDHVAVRCCSDMRVLSLDGQLAMGNPPTVSTLPGETGSGSLGYASVGFDGPMHAVTAIQSRPLPPAPARWTSTDWAMAWTIARPRPVIWAALGTTQSRGSAS